MIRKIIVIDEEKCNGCGLCASACHEGAIGIVGGKAKLLRDADCDGLGNCLPACPENAIGFEEREAAAFGVSGRLNAWPIQLKLVSPAAACFDDVELLISADCAAYSHGNFHHTFMRGKTTVIGCPKLDALDYSGKLCAIFKNHHIKSITLVRMEVPCCGGIVWMAQNALNKSEKNIELKIVTLSVEGAILEGKESSP
ncbi:MAG: 4Fe-4S binding protein [Spirochaetaceae bacterium]|nr:4Fe-4S binding protein [Spirochaetaceae bacterium]